MFIKKDVLLAQEYLAFLLLNMFDLFLTGYIFRHGGMEANGLAKWVLDHWQYHGFALYKFLLVTIIVLSCEGISLKNVRTSRVIVTTGCLLYVMVVFWECFLIITQVHGIHV